MSNSNIRNLIVISDTHSGCQFGLCPPKVTLDNGSLYTPNRFVNEVYAHWQQFWNEWVPHVTNGEPYAVIHNGDMIDNEHHGAKTPITTNLADQSKIARAVMEPVVEAENCIAYYQVRGTPSHDGECAEEAERIAEHLGASGTESGAFTHDELWIEMGSYLLHFNHHIGTTGSSSYESTAVYKELVEAFNEAGRWGDKPPNLVCRSHRHRQFEVRISTVSGYGIVIVTPGWQLKTPFVSRSATGRAGTPQVGGYLVRIGSDDGLYTRFKIWKIPRPRAITL